MDTFWMWVFVNLVWFVCFYQTMKKKNKLITVLKHGQNEAAERYDAVGKAADDALRLVHSISAENDRLRTIINELQQRNDTQSRTINGYQLKTKQNGVPSIALPASTSPRKIRI